MGKDIGQIYKLSQSQLSTSSLKAPVSSSSDPQTSSAIKLTTTCVPSATDKNQNNFVLYSQNTIQNDAIIDPLLSAGTSAAGLRVTIRTRRPDGGQTMVVAP